MSLASKAAVAGIAFTGAAALSWYLGDPGCAWVLGVAAVSLLGAAARERHEARVAAGLEAQAARERTARADVLPRRRGTCLTGLSDAEETVLDEPHPDRDRLRKLVWGTPSIGGREHTR